MLKDRRIYEVIPYEIHDYSTYASVYAPGNVKKNDPTDPNSRWSTTTNDHLQYITMKIPPSLVVTVTFGKYNKMHVCNVKKMRISVSEDDVTYREVLYGGLRNDTDMETFNLQTMDDTYFIAQYVKIEPLAAWGINFNYSLWFVELRGLTDVGEFVKYNEKMVFRRSVKSCLRFLRENGFRDVYERLESRSEEKLESDVVKTIRDLLEMHEYERVEEVLDTLSPGMFQEFIDNSPYTLVWTEIPKTENWPCERGGHQAVAMDGGLYLYGGWNGVEELEDFWKFCGGCWTQIKTGMRTPGRRSCHRMVAYMSRLYLMGKYVPLSSRKLLSGRSDIWCYDGDWKVINPGDDGGPGNVYDHQMVMVDGNICMFGGKSTEKEDTYAGLYMFSLEDSFVHGDERIEVVIGSRGDHMEPDGADGAAGKVAATMCLAEREGLSEMEEPCVRLCSETSSPIASASQRAEAADSPSRECIMATNEGLTPSIESLSCMSSSSLGLFSYRWKLLRSDTVQPPNTPSLKSRLGHTMIFIPPNYIPGNVYNNCLAIVGGQRNKDSMREMVFYSLETDTVFQNIPFPIKGDGKIVQRALLYSTEIVVLFCCGREKEGKFETIEVYTYSLMKGRWAKVQERSRCSAGVDIRPLPRSAHQFVEMNGYFYLFGGNVSEKTERRMNDLWVFKLSKKTPQDIRHLSKFLTRKHKYLRLLDTDEERAIDYLRSSVLSMVVDEDTRELFEELCYEVYRRRMFVDPIDDICRLLTIGGGH